MNKKLLIFSSILILFLFTSVSFGSASKYDLPENQDKLDQIVTIGWLSLTAIFFISLLLHRPESDENSPNRIYSEEYNKQFLKDNNNTYNIIFLIFALVAPFACLFFIFFNLRNLTLVLIGMLLLAITFVIIFIGHIHYTLQRDKRRKNARKIALEKTGLKPPCSPEFTPKVLAYTIIIFIIMFLFLDRFYFT